MKQQIKSILINQIPPFSFTDIRITGSGYEKTVSNKKPMDTKNYMYFSFHCILSGSGYIEVNGKTFIVEKNQLFVIMPSTPLVYYPSKTSPWKYAWINFIGTKAQELIDLLNIDPNEPIYTFTDPTVAKCFLNNALQCDSQSREAQFVALGNFYEIYAKLLQQIHITTSEPSANNNLVQQALQYINDNYCNPYISLNVTAAHLNVSPAYLSKLIKQGTNQNYTDLLTIARMQKAITLLNETDMSVKEIAYTVGFSDPFYFTNVFKRYNNCTPTQHRENVRNR